MITTEKEAKRKTCIDVRLRASTLPGATSGFNRSRMTLKEQGKEWAIGKFLPMYARHTRKKFLACTGSGCMAWRWVDGHRTHGYCGRAGTPQELSEHAQETYRAWQPAFHHAAWHHAQPPTPSLPPPEPWGKRVADGIAMGGFAGGAIVMLGILYLLFH